MTPTNAVEDTAKCCRIFLSSLDESLCFTEIKLDTRGTWKRTQLWWGITNKTISIGTCAVWWATPNLEDFSYRSIIRSHIYISAHPSRAWFISSLVSCCKESGSDSKLPLLIKISRDLKITKQINSSSFSLQRFQYLHTSDTSEFSQTVDMTGYRGPFNPKKAGPQ